MGQVFSATDPGLKASQEALFLPWTLSPQGRGQGNFEGPGPTPQWFVFRFLKELTSENYS